MGKKMICEICDKGKAIWECHACGAYHCENCGQSGECQICEPPELVEIQKK